MDTDSTFGTKPAQLKRLLLVGREESREDLGPVASWDLLSEQPGSEIGRYRLMHVLGEGGMGVVYLAEQEQPVKRQVALKIVRPGMDSKRVLARFEAEQQTLAMMEHPYIARVYDAGLAPSGRPYFVMEHVNGIPITEHCDQHRLTIEERLWLFLHVCEAVQHAHQKGVIHRDLKPSNILVAVQDEEAIPRIIDFGVARAIREPLGERTLFTEQGQLIGTPEYMSPEQADIGSQDIDTRTDIYSLGVILYELLVGVLPFDPKTFRESGIERIRKIICEEEPKTPSTRLSKTSVEESTESATRRQTDVRTLQRKLNGDLDWITLKAMEKDRTRRYATVDALATDIRNYLIHQPVSAAPPGTLYRAKKFARRHGQALVASAVTVLLLIGGLLTTIMYARVAKEHTHALSLEHRRMLGDAHVLVGNMRYKEALASIGPLLDSPYVGREARLAHARLLLEQNDLAAATVELETLLDRPDEIAGQAHFLLANINYEGDPWDSDKAEEYKAEWRLHSQQAQKLIGGTAEYHFLQAKASHDGRTMLKHLGEALALDRDHYDSLRERAYIYYAQKDYLKMEHDAARMAGLHSGNPAGWLLSALARREQGRWEEAILDHNEAIALAPQDAPLYLERRETYMRMGRYDLALVDAQRALALDPENLYYEVMVFAARVALGQYEQAEQQYRRLTSRPLTEAELRGCFIGTVVPMNPKDWFHAYATEYFFRTRDWKRPWSPPPEEPRCGIFWWMRESAQYYDRLIRRGRPIGPGADASWSPDGTKIVYTQGTHRAYATAILDVKTGTTELLTIPGNTPAWSPDGRYIAFVRGRENMSVDTVVSLLRWLERFRRMSRDPGAVDGIWIIDVATRDMRYIAKGSWPTWSSDSKRIYFASSLQEGGKVSWASIEDDPPVATQVLAGCDSGAPVVSPDERFVADAAHRWLRVFDAQSHQVVAEWVAPSFPANLHFNWSPPDSRELSVNGFLSLMSGVWILDTQTGEARRMLAGPASARRSPDRSKMAVGLGTPYSGLWLFEVDPNLPTAEALGEARTVDEHCRELIEYYTRGVQADPNYIDNHLRRTDAALWIDDSRAHEYLDELAGAFRRSPYHAGGCAVRAQTILSGPPELRDRLSPLSLLLARMAVAKDPNNPDYVKVLDAAVKATAAGSSLQPDVIPPGQP